MTIDKLTKAFAALSQNSRVQILKMVLGSGSDGICPCELIDKLELTNANLSFHLKELENAGLVNKNKKGRFIYYFAKCDVIESLGRFLITGCGNLKKGEK